MPGLIAIAIPAGPGYVELIEQIWEAGDAFCPIDLRLPVTERERVLEALAPTEIVELVAGTPRRRRLTGGRPTEDGDALVIATSGTEGQPKAVIHTRHSIQASAEATSAALGVDPSADRWLACLPLAHIGGLSVILRSLVTGTPLTVHDGFDGDNVIAAAKNEGVTLVSLVTRALRQVPTELFRTVLIGGAAPPPGLPDNVVPTYGMTETGSGVVYRDRILNGCEISLVDDQGAKVNQAGGNGEILIRGPMLFRGYRNLPSPLTADGWYPTGDIGRWSSVGTLEVEGRRGDVIVSGGEMVWPGPIEQILADRSDVAEVAVIGRPDPEWGHRVVAVVVPADPTNPPMLDAIRNTVLGRFPAWCAPKDLELRTDPLPRTSLGKLRRRAVL